MITKKLFIAIFSFATCVTVFGQGIGVLYLSPLHIELPGSWQFDGSKMPIEGYGPNGEKLLVTILRLKPDATVTSAEDNVLGMLERLEYSGTKDGQQVVRELSKFPVHAGKAGYSMASEESSLFGAKKHFIQYLLASSHSVIYLTFEGRGAVSSVLPEYDRYLATQTWDDEG